MRPQKIDDIALLEKLMEVFRAKGYEGASLNELAASAGLKKASLYHRFPGGKEEIAAAVLQFSQEWGKQHIEHTLSNTDHSPKERIDTVINNIDNLYACGAKTCLLRALSMDTGITTLSSLIQTTMNTWISSFTTIGEELGFSQAEAHNHAKQTLIQIQGSLVLSKGLNDKSIFQDTLQNIKKLYYSKI